MIPIIILEIIVFCAIWVLIALLVITYKIERTNTKKDKVQATEAVKALNIDHERLAERLKITPEKLQERLTKHNWTSHEINILPAVLNYLSKPLR